VTLVGGSRLLARFPERVRRLALDALLAAGVSVMEDAHLEELGAGSARLDRGRTIQFDMAALATGVSPPELFEKSGLAVGPDGGMLVNERLQSVSYPELLGGGDCIAFKPQPLPRIGVFAVRQNPILAHNVLAKLDDGQPRVFRPGSLSNLLILNMGDSTGILHWRGFSVRSRLALRLKDWIDRRFMRRFQVSGELEDDS
jgi:NADH dehydrogenase FAD-containing subunit